ncbi:hypothetical protein JCM16814_06770 [Desulfobaculum senezii]
MRHILGTALALCIFLGSAAQSATAARLPFAPGEKLTYSLRWEAIPAGTATLEVLPHTQVNDAPALHFRMKAWTNAFADIFYTVRDEVNAYTAPDLEKSVHYTQRQREGSYKRDITVSFLWETGQAQYANIINGPKDPILILPGTFDPLSVFYAFRRMPLKKGAQLYAPVTDGVKSVMGRATVLRRERLTVPAGTFDTWVVEPELRHIGGVFKKSKDARLLVWVTADERKIPVQVSSRVIVGRFFAVLTDIVPGQPHREDARPSHAPRPAQMPPQTEQNAAQLPPPGTAEHEMARPPQALP